MVTCIGSWETAVWYAIRKASRTGRRHVVKRDPEAVTRAVWRVAEVGVL